jgi:peptidyl-tRNA hydrolase
VGIGRPESRDPEVVSEYVLSDLPAFERDKILETTIPVVWEYLKSQTGSSTPSGPKA